MIILDVRENKLVELFTEGTIDFEKKLLDVGDIQISKGGDEQVDVVIERKTVSDLSSSIIDGRYREQKARLLETKIPIIYVIEGKLEVKRGVPLTTIWNAMIHSMLRDKCFVFRTDNIKQTMEFIIQINKCFDKGMKKNTEIQYNTKAFVSKSDNKSDPNIIYHCQLRAIPGVSDSISKAIRSEFETMPVLLEYLQENNTETTINTIKNLQSGKRKIGPVVAKRIISCFCGNQ